MSISTKLAVLAVAESISILRYGYQVTPLKSVILLAAGLWLGQLLVWGAWTCVIQPIFLSPLKTLPGPKESYIITGRPSAARAIARSLRKFSGDVIRRWSKEFPNGGLVMYRGFLNEEVVILTTPAALSEVLTTKSYAFVKHPQVRNTIGYMLGVGILLAEGDEHKRQRRLLNPAFSFGHVKELYPSFWSKACESVIKMQQTMDTVTVESPRDAYVLDVGQWGSRVTLDIIGVTGMGYDFNAIQNPESELLKCYHNLFEFEAPTGLRLLAAVVLPFSIFIRLPIGPNRAMLRARRVVRAVAQELITKRRAALKGEDENKHKDLLATAIRSGGFSDEDLINQLMTFMAAGHETTASGMVWACYLLCTHRDVQAKLREEIRRQLPSPKDNQATVRAEDLTAARLPYLFAVMNETLRLFPPVPVTSRVAATDETILGQPIPKGTAVVIAPWAINHSTEQWGPDAGEFKPERWLQPGQANSGGVKSAFSNLTFLHGPRSCIGMGFARAEFACILAAWVGTWEMELKDEPHFKLEVQEGITAHPKGGLEVRFLPVKGW